MINVCHKCGIYRSDKEIDPSGPYAVCPECGFKHKFHQLPLLVVSGASGAGKSTVLNNLILNFTDAVLLESDILWRVEFNKPEEGYRDYFKTWLRMCKNISQAGKPVVLFGAGMGVPENLEKCSERRYFSIIHYLALICDEKSLKIRLNERPEWRNSSEENFIKEQIRFNRWFIENADKQVEPITLLDTTNAPVGKTVDQVASWILDKYNIP